MIFLAIIIGGVVGFIIGKLDNNLPKPSHFDPPEKKHK